MPSVKVPSRKMCVQIEPGRTLPVIAWLIIENDDDPYSPRLLPMVADQETKEGMTLLEYLRLHPEVDVNSLWLRDMVLDAAGQLV
jgi:hypothetical protein